MSANGPNERNGPHGLVIRGVDADRQLSQEQLPIRMGTSTDCDLRLPGPGFAAIATIDLLDGEPIVQPLASDAAITLNDELLKGSRRLGADDVLGYFGSRIRVSQDAAGWVLDVSLDASAYVTRPPELEPATDAAEEAIAATKFERAAEVAATAATDSGHRLRNVVGVALVVLLLASYLLFSARSIQFDVAPVAADEIDIDGGWFRLPLGDRVLLRQGEYTVNVTRAGYYPVSQGFVVDEAPSATVSVELRRLPGQLTVVVPGTDEAEVSIDGVARGTAPLGPVELQPGRHSISVNAERYLPFGDVTNIIGMGNQQTVHVQLVPRWSEVTVESEPAGARIFSGDEELGTTPGTVQLLEGTHQLTVLLDGYRAWDGSVNARPNVPQTLPPIELEPADARLRVASIPTAANVTVNGRFRGRSPVTLDLSPDIDYQIGLSKAGYGSTTRQVRLRAAAREEITVDLSARTGTVTINVSPNDADVLVNGRVRGKGTTTLRLSAAPQSIEVRKAGYQSWKQSVTPRPGFAQTLTAELRTLEAIASEKIAQTVSNSLDMTLRRIEPGSFSMGASRAEPGRRANEVIVPVRLTRPFLIGTHEVSNDQFWKFRANHDSGSALSPTMTGKDNAVANVSWSDAVQFCNWLSAREGLPPVYEEKFGEWVAIRPFPDGYRLPTEAEWAWALRYETKQQPRRFPWGENWPPRKDSGNFAGQTALGLAPTLLPDYDDGFAVTAPIGSFRPNSLGLHDGGGNVAEWVNDYYWVPTPGITAPISNPLGPPNGQSRVIRGSSWRHGTESELRLSYRDNGNSPRADVGFRVVRNAD